MAALLTRLHVVLLVANLAWSFSASASAFASEVGANADALKARLLAANSAAEIKSVLRDLNSRESISEQLIEPLHALLKFPDESVRERVCVVLRHSSLLPHADPDALASLLPEKGSIAFQAISTLEALPDQRAAAVSVERVCDAIHEPLFLYKSIAVVAKDKPTLTALVKRHPQLIWRLDHPSCAHRKTFLQILESHDESDRALQQAILKLHAIPAAELVRLSSSQARDILAARCSKSTGKHKEYLLKCLVALGEIPTDSISASDSVSNAEAVDVAFNRRKDRGPFNTRRSFTKGMATGDVRLGDGSIPKSIGILSGYTGDPIEKGDWGFNPDTGRFWIITTFMCLAHSNDWHLIVDEPVACQSKRFVIVAPGSNPVPIGVTPTSQHLKAVLSKQL